MIEILQKKLTALFMGVSCLLFLAIFALLVVRDVQSAHAADRAMFQNQFSSLSYQAATAGVLNRDQWEASPAVIRLRDETGAVVWQTKGGFASVPAALWQSFETQLQQVGLGLEGEEPAIVQSHIMTAKAADNSLYIGSRAIVKTMGGGVQMVEMLQPQTRVAAVIWKNSVTYVFILTSVLVVLGLLSRFLVIQALKPARRSLQSQKNFIAAASHELKTPLSVIQLNNSEVKNMVEDGSKAENLLDISLQESKRMGRLIGDMLALASSDAGHWQIRMDALNMETLLLQAYEKHSPVAAKKGLQIEMNLPEEAFPPLKGDAGRIEQVLDILLDNALRHSPANSTVAIQAKLRAKAVAVSVVDHGDGVADEHKPLVFDRFFQGDASRTQRDNFGLGLSIAQEIMTQHGGKIQVSDTPNGGATFTVWLPV